MEKQISTFIEDHKDLFLDVSHKIWKHPELAFKEYYASSILKEVFKQNEFKIIDNIAGMETAFSATYGRTGPIITFLGEYDALPGLSQQSNKTIYKPVKEGAPGHGCGHNVLGSGCLAAAIALKDWIKSNNIEGIVRFYGCPAEENGSGKMRMVSAGVFDDVDVALTWHPDSKNVVMTRSQLANASYIFEFKGRSSHAASAPYLGRSALDACELMNIGANYLREHVHSDVRFHYAYLNVGGNAPNVVQKEATVNYYIRAPRVKEVISVSKRLKDVARGAALMTGTKLKIIPCFGMCDYRSNDIISKIMAETLQECKGPQFDEADQKLAQTFYKKFEAVQIEADLDDLKLYLGADKETQNNNEKVLFDEIIPYRKVSGCKMGSSDVGDVSYIVPTAWLSMTTVTFGTPFHHYYATAQMCSSIADKALLCAANVLAQTAAKLLKNPRIIQQAQKELKDTTGGIYLSPLGE